MTEKEKQEREEVFLVCVLFPKERELYRKYGHLRADEMPTDSGIPNLRARMCDILHRLACAGMFDDDLPMPYENRSAEENLFRGSYCNGEDDPFISTFAEFAVMRGGRLACFDALNWMDGVEYILHENGIEENELLPAWPMDDEPMAVRFCVSDEWCEVHTRRELPSVLDAFKAEVAKYLSVLCEGSEDEKWTSENLPALKFPMSMHVVFEIPCRGGIKVSVCGDEENGCKEHDWIWMECLPLTDARKGVMVSGADRDIRSLIRR